MASADSVCADLCATANLELAQAVETFSASAGPCSMFQFVLFALLAGISGVLQGCFLGLLDNCGWDAVMKPQAPSMTATEHVSEAAIPMLGLSSIRQAPRPNEASEFQGTPP